MADTKICPFCAEEIKTAAIKCRYCQSELPAQSMTQSMTQPMTPPPTPPATAPTATPTATPTAPPTAPPSERPAPEAPPTTPAPTATLAPARPGPRWLLSAFAAAVVLLAAGVGYLGWDLASMNADSRAGVTGRDAAAAHVERILSYDYESFDEGTAQARRLMTESFAKEYDDTVALVREDAVDRKSVVTAEVVAASVVSARADRVEALLFVNQTTEAADLEQPRLDLNRVVVTLVPGAEQGEWLVDDVEAL